MMKALVNPGLLFCDGEVFTLTTWGLWSKLITEYPFIILYSNAPLPTTNPRIRKTLR